jgi:hypothetical protein
MSTSISGDLISNTWPEFLHNIAVARRSLNSPDIVWYRGHAESGFKLIPSLLRFETGLAKEKDLFFKYKQAAIRLMQKRDDDWETLFDMQHYHVPTRLLDWSEVLGVAVFFALMWHTEEAAVFVLDPRHLNTLATGHSEIKRVGLDFQYRQIYWDKKPFAAIKPIAMEPPFQNDRMLAQKGMFTIHGDDRSPLEEQCPTCVRKIVITKTAMNGAWEFLGYANINEFSVFPDIVGLAPYIKHIVKLQ